MLKVVDEGLVGEGHLSLDEIARRGAQRMLATSLEEEVAEYIARHASARDDRGHRLVVRNGKARARKVTCGAGTIEVRAPRVNDKRVDDNGQRQRFTSRILPPYMRRSPKVAEVLPILYLRGLSTGDFKPALSCLLGEDAAGLSATNIARLTAVWEDEYREFRRRDLSDRDYVYVWADGIHFNVRLRQRVTKGAGNRTKALTMAFKLLDMAQLRWRRLNGAHLLPLVRAGVTFVDGVQLERQEQTEDRKEAA